MKAVTHATAHVWRSEDNPQASGHRVGLEDQTQVTMSERQALLPTELSHQSQWGCYLQHA